MGGRAVRTGPDWSLAWEQVVAGAGAKTAAGRAPIPDVTRPRYERRTGVCRQQRRPTKCCCSAGRRLLAAEARRHRPELQPAVAVGAHRPRRSPAPGSGHSTEPHAAGPRWWRSRIRCARALAPVPPSGRTDRVVAATTVQRGSEGESRTGPRRPGRATFGIRTRIRRKPERRAAARLREACPRAGGSSPSTPGAHRPGTAPDPPVDRWPIGITPG